MLATNIYKMIGNPGYAPQYEEYEYQPSAWEDGSWVHPDTKRWLKYYPQQILYDAGPFAYGAAQAARLALGLAHIGNVGFQTWQDYKKQRAEEAERLKINEQLKRVEDARKGESQLQISDSPFEGNGPEEIYDARLSPPLLISRGPLKTLGPGDTGDVIVVDEPQTLPPVVQQKPKAPSKPLPPVPQYPQYDYVPSRQQSREGSRGRSPGVAPRKPEKINFEVPDVRLIRSGQLHNSGIKVSANAIDTLVTNLGFDEALRVAKKDRQPAFPLFTQEGAKEAFYNPWQYIPPVMTKYYSPNVANAIKHEQKIKKPFGRRQPLTQEETVAEANKRYAVMPKK